LNRRLNEPAELSGEIDQQSSVIGGDCTGEDQGTTAGIAARAQPSLACRLPVRCILNLMVQYTNARLDASFAALSDVTRRGVLEQLGRAEASISDLAQKFNMTLTGMKKHVSVLEQAGLVITEKLGRVRTCKIGPHRLQEATAWLEKYRRLWAARFDELDGVVEDLKQREKFDGRKKRE
jgi:DNA-binding transcriptional ArsR family regulator